MTIFKRSLSALALAMLAVGAAQAAPTLSYGVLPGAGTYYGSGNFDANWTVAQDNGTILGLGFKDRQTFALLDGSSGTYVVAMGNYPGGGSRQHLSYQFSGQGAVGTTYQLCVDHDPTGGVAMSCVDPTVYWSDNYSAGAGTFQNSQNVGFGDTPGGPFNPNQGGYFSFTLTAFGLNGAPIDSVSALVQVVPEPASIALMGLGLLGLVATRRRKQG